MRRPPCTQCHVEGTSILTNANCRALPQTDYTTGTEKRIRPHLSNRPPSPSDTTSCSECHGDFTSWINALTKF